MHSRPIRRILIADLDNCSFTINQEVNGKLLSRKFVAHAKKAKYAAFYVCTHRTAGNYKTNLLDPLVVIEKNIERNQAYENQAEAREAHRYADVPFFTEEHLSHVFTHKIIEHLEQETGLTCIAVSTPGDVEQCGEAYTSKNQQLMKVIEDVLARHPDEKQVFDFVDDRLDLCQAALALCDKLPKNVVLNVFHHDAFDSTRLKQLNNLPMTQNNYCNFFTKVAAITTGIAAVAYVATQNFRA
jgi:hypothetical protein